MLLSTSGDILAKWNDLRAHGVNLGSATSGVVNDTFNGQIEHFQYGDIDWVPGVGAHEVHGAILAKWNDLRAHGINLGHPTSDEMNDGFGGRISYFQGGVIDWTPQTGAHEVHGAILAKWNDLRAHGINLGHPTSDEMNDGFGGRISYFQGGVIDWTPQTGAHEVHGAILAKWNDLRAHGINLGHPTSDEMNAPSDLRVGPGRISYFQGGDIAWTPATGAFEVGVRSINF